MVRSNLSTAVLLYSYNSKCKCIYTSTAEEYRLVAVVLYYCCYVPYTHELQATAPKEQRQPSTHSASENVSYAPYSVQSASLRCKDIYDTAVVRHCPTGSFPISESTYGFRFLCRCSCTGPHLFQSGGMGTHTQQSGRLFAFTSPESTLPGHRRSRLQLRVHFEPSPTPTPRAVCCSWRGCCEVCPQ